MASAATVNNLIQGREVQLHADIGKRLIWFVGDIKKNCMWKFHMLNEKVCK